MVIVYFGEWPVWFSLFIRSCEANKELNFLFFSDNKNNFSYAENITHIFITKQEFSILASEKLGFKVNIINPIKLCDYKPAYGIIFEDHLTDYEYWGFMDIDVIIGMLIHNMDFYELRQFDILSGYQDYISGPFCILRNIKRMNTLFTMVFDYRNLLKNPNQTHFDEHIVKPENKGLTFKKIYLFVVFLLISVVKNRNSLFHFAEMKYRFQWFVKKHSLNQPVDFTEIIMIMDKKKKINVKFKETIDSDRKYKRLGIKKWHIEYNHGQLINKKNNTELFVFHFQDLKKELIHHSTITKIDHNYFSIIPDGFMQLKQILHNK